MARDSISSNTPDLRTFMQELEARLNLLSHEELKSLLLRRARGLTPRERNSFLAIFPAVAEDKPCVPKTSDRDDELIADIEAFVKALEDGEYFEGWGWDDSIHDERAYGDMSWTEDMDDLFTRASDMYLAGHRDLAAEAYDKLLHAFELEEETGHFCGEGSPESLVVSDVTEAKARYLRCIYETSSSEDRVARMIEETKNLYYIGGDIGLSDIINADTKPLPDNEEFLREWITGLKALGSEDVPVHRRSWWRPLLREAVVLKNGVDGLAGLARESGDVHPEAYQEWVMSLWQSGDSHSAISAAREGVERIVNGGQKARLADALATMSARTGDSALALTARKGAWRALPTLRRLLLYCGEGTPDREILDARLSEELDGASSGSYTIPSALYHSKGTPRLQLLLHLLAHDYNTAVRQAEKMKPLGWSSSEHPGMVVFPFLTLAASGLTARPDEGSSLAHLMNEMAIMLGNRSSNEPLLPETADEPTGSMLGRLLLDTLSSHPVTPEDKSNYLNMAKRIAKKRIDSIVSNTYRGAYERAARLTVAVGETMALRGAVSAASSGMDFVLSVRVTYPRHIAFRKELDELIERSPYLPFVPSRKKK